MYKLFLFDFDGTLLNSDPMLKVTFEELYKKFKPDFHPDDSHYFEFSGPPIKETLKKQFPELDQEMILKEFRDLSYINYDLYTEVYPYVFDVLKVLKEKGIAFGMVTNKARKATNKALKLFGLETYLDYVITSDDVDNQKPNPEGIFKAMEHFGITNKKDVLYIGDSIYDLKTADNSGVDFGYVLWSPRKLPLDAKIDVKIKDYLTFAEEIKNGKV